MPQIKILPADLANKIAAGEVVERPASVVKELTENAIDAGASHITIEIQDAGKRLIRITDDGCGMEDGEIALSLQRHSTSKIVSLDDLFNIKTLGFRGEALPAIASVSRFSISKNPNGSGITVKAEELFYNTPARLKFMKSKYTELSHIQEIVNGFTMSNPKIAFKLLVDGKEVLSSPGNGKLFDAVFSVYGLELARELVEVKGENIHGFVSKPNVSRLDRGMESFFVNGRIVKNFLLSRALEEAYRNLIPNNRYPVAVLFISVPPAEIDVNVHPAKREVKFLKTKEVMDEITSAVKAALGEFTEAGNWDTNINPNDKNQNPNEIQNPNSCLPAGTVQFQISGVQDQIPVFNLEATRVLPLVPLYQLQNTYIVCTDGEDLVLIDSHAAHERILFDRICNASRVSSQVVLLIPETLEINKTDYAAVESHLDILKELGFEMEVFGSNTFMVRSVPSILSKEPLKETILDLLSEIKNEGSKTKTEEVKDRINKYMACRGAVKAGDKLETSEIEQLISDLYKTENPMTCPHGRPTMVRINKDTMEHLFGRK